MEKNISRVLIGVLVLVIIFGFVAFKAINKDTKNAEEQKTFEESTIYLDFMEGCIDGDPAMYTYCDCAITHIHKNIGSNGIMKMSLDYVETGEYSEPMLDAISACY